ncbi:ion transporter [Porphyromonas macacae]|uniref:Voltage-gated potassium channel n=1 Tax=Porphyromonas macacae TaxID=28115 RepID=A0A379E8Y5_9PORP|nr:ion transporter [Porphyromonas macacae]KGN99891.1 ion transporter [Porphyromonas macacae]SUB89157.1 Voltage-gated potassium channel [Porphyromonas macacae]
MKNNLSNRFSFLNLAVLVLSIYVLIALIVDTLFKLPEQTSILLNYIDMAICLFFFADFCIRFHKSHNKLKFMRWGWIDLISSIPMINFLRFGRIFRLLRLIRIVKAFHTTKEFVSYIFKDKAKGSFSSAAILAILMIIFSSIAILQVENMPESNIRTAEDAVWWAFTTITTVGYGDRYPITIEGRIIALFLMTAGVGLFGTFTAYIASIFVSDKDKEINA